MLGYGLDDRGSRFRFPAGGLGIFLFATVFRMAMGPTQPPIQWVAGALSLGVKRLRREAGHSPLSSAEVKNAWSYISTPQYVFMAWCLVKHKDNFTFTLLRFLFSLLIHIHSESLDRVQPIARPLHKQTYPGAGFSPDVKCSGCQRLHSTRL
jgi:hypothetical protein